VESLRNEATPAPEDPNAFDLKSAAATFESDGVTLVFPVGWVQYSAEQMQASQDRVRTMGKVAPTWDYAIQSPCSGPQVCPYVLVRVIRSGRITKAALDRASAQNTQSAQNATAAVAGKIGSIVSDVVAGGTTYDPARQIILAHFSGDFVGEGKLAGTMATILTNFGGVRIIGYSTEADAATFDAQFKQILNQAEVARAVRYETTFREKYFNWLSYFSAEDAIKGAAAAVLFGGAGAYQTWKKRRAARKAQTPLSVS
jgi:hypothetical protein